MTQTDTKTIMIVEDEPDTAEMLSEMIRLLGHRVVKSYNSAAALKLLGQERPDVLLLDVLMPGMSGLEMVKSLRKNPGLKSLPVILVSGNSLPSDIQDGMEAGASGYLTKPVTFSDLKHAIEQTLATS